MGHLAYLLTLQGIYMQSPIVSDTEPLHRFPGKKASGKKKSRNDLTNDSMQDKWRKH